MEKEIIKILLWVLVVILLSIAIYKIMGVLG